jgi:hypothetical protein
MGPPRGEFTEPEGDAMEPETEDEPGRPSTVDERACAGIEIGGGECDCD